VTPQLQSGPGGRERSGWSYSVRASRNESYDVVCHAHILALDDTMLANAFRDEAPILIVSTPSVDRIYGHKLRRYVAENVRRAPVSFMVLECSEPQKGMDQVLAVCQRAAEARLARRSQIVCVGGGVSLDISGLAATLFRRGIPFIGVPTTLIGMIDAAIGVKNGINFGGSKSMLGAFSPPEMCIVDPSFLVTVPRRHLQCGLAEVIKIATMCSPELFACLEVRSDQLLDEVCGMPLELAEDLVQLSIQCTLSELELNLFERNELFPDTYARKLDFGHTFSPYIEVGSVHRILHGEAVAIDMAVSAELAYRLGILEEALRDRFLYLLRRVGLPIYPSGIDNRRIYASLESVVRHRNGNLNLVLPAGLGCAAFIRDLSDISATLVSEVIQRLSQLSLREDAYFGG
jgi:3-dehydroquinate synthase